MREKRPGMIEEHIYLGDCEVYRRRAAGGVLVGERQAMHLSDGQGSLATVEMRTLGADGGPARVLHYFHEDDPGAFSVEVDLQTNVISLAEFYPHGQLSFRAARSVGELSDRVRFDGRENDPDTGLLYDGTSFHAPWLGRRIDRFSQSTHINSTRQAGH
ncbi:MAG: hypothetical protein H0T78_03565 [Longispora sp.]|nr:hypothetical protein [Longispora sp. (in: high G+C Gram-positive bacteria)]